MAVTGLVLFGFLILHMLGNLQVFLGRELMNHYAETLHGNPGLLWVARVVLLVSVVLHTWAAIQLTLHHELAREFGLPDSLGDRLEEYFRARYPQFCRVTDDTRATLETLRRRSLKTGVITNGPTYWQTLKIEAMGIAPLFDTVLISENEGIGKPDARIFALAVERCGVTASESMFVGDHPEADILGAKAAGLVPIWKRMSYWSVPDEVQRIDRISEILPLIG